MSKSIGRIMISVSNEALIDMQMLARVMNRYLWSMSEMHFKINSRSNEIELTDDGWCDEPTVFPMRLTSLEIFDPTEPDEIKTLSPEEILDFDFEDVVDYTSVEAKLDQICNEISAAISEGYVVISCDAKHTNSKYSYQGILKIYSDGSGTQEYSLHNHIDPMNSIHKSFRHQPNVMTLSSSI